MYPLTMLGQHFNIVKVPLKWDISKHEKYMRDATECINSIVYGLLDVIKAIFSNGNELELIMNYIKHLSLGLG